MSSVGDSPRDPRFQGSQGLNAMNKYLTVMARDVPKELRRSAKFRAAMRRKAR